MFSSHLSVRARLVGTRNLVDALVAAQSERGYVHAPPRDHSHHVMSPVTGRWLRGEVSGGYASDETPRPGSAVSEKIISVSDRLRCKCPPRHVHGNPRRVNGTGRNAGISYPRHVQRECVGVGPLRRTVVVRDRCNHVRVQSFPRRSTCVQSATACRWLCGFVPSSPPASRAMAPIAAHPSRCSRASWASPESTRPLLRLLFPQECLELCLGL